MANPSFVKNARPAGTPAPSFVKDAREAEPEHGMGTQLMDFADEFQDAATFGAGDALAAAELAKFRTVFGDAKLVDIMKTYREERAAQEEARAALGKRDTIGGDIGTVAGIALPAVIGAAAAAPTAAARLGGSATSAGRAAFAPQGAVNVTRLGRAVQAFL